MREVEPLEEADPLLADEEIRDDDKLRDGVPPGPFAVERPDDDALLLDEGVPFDEELVLEVKVTLLMVGCTPE